MHRLCECSPVGRRVVCEAIQCLVRFWIKSVRMVSDVTVPAVAARTRHMYFADSPRVPRMLEKELSEIHKN